MATVVITGANRGIGLALAKHYSEAGDTVIGLCRDPAAASELAALKGVTVGEIDIVDQASVDRAAASVDGPVDLLFNNAGVLGGRDGAGADQALDTVDQKVWLETFDIMAIGPFRVTRAFVPQLARAKGKVVWTSSQLAASTWPYGGLYSYGSAKAAGNRVVQSLARDLADKGIIVISIHPGYVQTDMGGPGADITPAESASGIAKVAAGLSPEQSGGFFKWNGEEHPL